MDQARQGILGLVEFAEPPGGVPFKTGFNTDTYKYYIDFAAQNGIEYVNLDEGWSDQFDLLKVTNKLDMPEVIRYAKEKM